MAFKFCVSFLNYLENGKNGCLYFTKRICLLTRDVCLLECLLIKLFTVYCICPYTYFFQKNYAAAAPLTEPLDDEIAEKTSRIVDTQVKVDVCRTTIISHRNN